MTPKERIMTALLLEEPDTVPVSPVFYKQALNFLPQDFYDKLTKISDGVYRIGIPANGVFYSASKRVKVVTRKAVFPDHEIHESVRDPQGSLVFQA